MARATLMVIDGHAVAFRAYHALRDAQLRATATGELTFGVFGFCQIVLTQLQTLRPDYVAIAFDVGSTFRHEQYADYKAGRAETPPDFEQQLQRMKEVVNALNIPTYTAEGFEADDVIGTLGVQATAQGVETFILTGDTDTLQLVDDHVRVLLSVPFRNSQEVKTYDLDAVRERYGLEPHQLTDLRGLKGDTSDNIPGVKGIGEAGAISLLKQFGTVEGIYEHLAEVPKRYQSKLDGQQDAALFSKYLATIRQDVPVTLDLQAARLRDYNREAVAALFRELELGRLLSKLPDVGAAAAAPPPAPPTTFTTASGTKLTRARPTLAAPTQDSFDLDDVFGPSTAKKRPATTLTADEEREEQQTNDVAAFGDYRAVTTPEQLDELVAALTAAPVWAFDTETSGLEHTSHIVGLSFSDAAGRAWYVPVGHKEGAQLDHATVRAALQPLFEDGNRPKVGHNAKFDIRVLRRWGCEVRGLAFDTMIAAQMLNKRGDLKDLAFYEFELEMTQIETLIGKGKTQITFADVPLARATPYACADADITMRLLGHLQPQLAAVPRIRDLFERIEMPLIPVLVDMEWAGIMVDGAVLSNLATFFEARLATLEGEMTTLAGQAFNSSSSQQVSDVLFGKLQLPSAGLGKVKSGHYSITAEVLDKLRDKHPIIELLIEHRQLNKLKSTYVDAFPSLLDEHSRVHTSYNQLGASTGRLSSTAPNLQNIPIRTEQGREIRRAFVAAPGYKLLAADYSQVELRILAHITQDPALIEIFRAGQDIHTATAARLFNVPMEQVTRNQRRLAKTTVFGTVYGISAFGLSARTELNREESQQLINGLFASYPGLRKLFDETLDRGRSQGYVETLYGRRRYMPELTAVNGSRRQAAEREAINAPIQGTSADITKMAMVRLHDELRRRAMNTRMLLQVHDELVLEVPDDEIAEARQVVQAVMEGVAPELSVPLEVHTAVGPNWDELA